MATPAQAAVRLGIDVLESTGYAFLKGKRVGLVTNQTGVDSNGVATRVLLKKNVNLVALYTPEHGLDGTEKAGRYVSSRRDRLTGLIAYSLRTDTQTDPGNVARNRYACLRSARYWLPQLHLHQHHGKMHGSSDGKWDSIRRPGST